ncbi:AraC family transcriptional regulator, partial [Paraburkholderia sp. SIMBA_061]
GFDFVLMELPQTFMTRACYERSGSGTPRVSSLAGRKDPILGHLAQILSLTLERQSEASPLFVEQLGVMIGTHLIDRYGGASCESKRNSR